MKDLNQISYDIIGAAYKVHSALGPGLLESIYETCLVHELQQSCYKLDVQKPLPVFYKGITLNAGYRLDILVEDQVIIEIKATDGLAPIHTAQLLTYLKLTNIKLGLLINFNVVHLKEGIKRVIL